MGNGKGEFGSAERANKMARGGARVLARLNFRFLFPLNRLPRGRHSLIPRMTSLISRQLSTHLLIEKLVNSLVSETRLS